MKVSIIIPTYNEEQNISACLDSLFRQTYKDFEVIVVDDGSSDNTLLEIRNSVAKPKMECQFEICILHQAHRGAGAARNLGAKKAEGEILVFVDADMTFNINFINDLIKPIVDGKVVGTFSKNEMLANKNNIWAICWNLNRGLPGDRMHPVGYPDTQKVFRAILKSEFDRVGGFNAKAGYTDDWSLSERLGVEARVAPGAIFYHRNPDSLKEVFIQSKWMAKRKYKFGLFGLIIALLRVSLLLSLLKGLFLSIRYHALAFVVFKLVSDLGQFFGILEYQIFRKVSK